ncbi:unnamed protein product, partial [Mesorhabditis spiculigera]
MTDLWFTHGKSVAGSRVQAIDEKSPGHETYELMKQKFASFANPESKLRFRTLTPEEPEFYGITYELRIVNSVANVISATFYPSLATEDGLPSCQLQHPYKMQFEEDTERGGKLVLYSSPDNSEQLKEWLKKEVFEAMVEWLYPRPPSAPPKSTKGLITGEAFARTDLPPKPFKKYISAIFSPVEAASFASQHNQMVHPTSGQCRARELELEKKKMLPVGKICAHLEPRSPGHARIVIKMLKEDQIAEFCDCL